MSDFIPGRNSVREAMEQHSISKLYLASDKPQKGLEDILKLANQNNVPVVKVPMKKLDSLYKGNHQGILGETGEFRYSEIEDMLKLASDRGEAPFLLMPADIESPHNLGAIMRTAEIAGVHGIIIPKNNAVAVNATVNKIACGAGEYIPVARVTNLVRTAKDLQKQGLWVYGADMDGTSMWQQDMTGPVLLVIGGEDRGIPRLLKETCDFIVSIPMKGHISSLNASVAAGVTVYEIMRQRQGKGQRA